MGINDRIILHQIIEGRMRADEIEVSIGQFFEQFVAELVLKDFDLSVDEIDQGLVGGGDDGGIDGFYVLINGELAHEDSDFSSLKKHIVIDVYIIQAKYSTGFQQSVIEKISISISHLLDLNKSSSSLLREYNKSVTTSAEIFRNNYKTVVSKFPKINFNFVYASQGSEVHPKISLKIQELELQIKELFSESNFKFHLLGASELLDRARRQKVTSYSLPFIDALISSAGDAGYICLVNIFDYYNFIIDESGDLNRELFDANVRDYQGSTNVNDEIASSLTTPFGEDFWWLNNGITIISSKATLSGKTLTLEEPQIVNGLQTSTEIYRYACELKGVAANDKRNVLVRAVITSDSESRDRIIKATNSQTPIPPASLRATDKIQRDIEDHLFHKGLFYDRRKNKYKLQGKPISKIVGIPLLAQSVMSILLQRPNDARARPSNLIKSDHDYKEIFSENNPIEFYFVAAILIKEIDNYLRTIQKLPSQERNNIKFHLSMIAVRYLTKKTNPSAADIAKIEIGSIEEGLLSTLYSDVQRVFSDLGGTDQVAKGSEFVERLKMIY